MSSVLKPIIDELRAVTEERTRIAVKAWVDDMARADADQRVSDLRASVGVGTDIIGSGRDWSLPIAVRNVRK
jgi:hypothetical protein